MRTDRPLLAGEQLAAACRAWEMGGCQLLGLWGARHLASWGTHTYALLVAQVRTTLGDDTDYSARPEEHDDA